MSVPPDDVPEVESIPPFYPVERIGIPEVEAVHTEALPSLIPGKAARHGPNRPFAEFGMAIVWCAAFWAVTLFGMLVGAIPTVVVVMLSAPPETPAEKIFAMNPGEPVTPGVAWVLVVAMGTAQIAALIFTLCVLRVRVGVNWTRAIRLRTPRWSGVALALLVLPGLMIGHGLVHELVQLVFPAGESAEQMNKILGGMFKQVPLLLALFVVGVLPGVGEELFCRGYLAWGLVARCGAVAGVLLTSLLFGLLHLDPRYAIGTAVMGLMLHVILRASGSLWTTILLHTLNNSLSVMASMAAEGKAAANEGTPLYLAVAAVANILVVGGVWAVSRVGIKPDSTPGVETAIAWGEIVPPRPAARPGALGWALVLASFGATVAAAIHAG